MQQFIVDDGDDLGSFILKLPVVSRILVIFNSIDLKKILKYYDNKSHIKAEGLVPYMSNDCWGVLFYCTNIECEKELGEECMKCFEKCWKENDEVEVLGVRGH